MQPVASSSQSTSGTPPGSGALPTPPATDTATAPAVPLGGTEAVLNQVAELKRVRALLKAELEKVKDAPAQKIAHCELSTSPAKIGLFGSGSLLIQASEGCSTGKSQALSMDTG